MTGGPATFVALVFLVLLVVLSAYVYSELIAGLIDLLLRHTRTV